MNSPVTLSQRRGYSFLNAGSIGRLFCLGLWGGVYPVGLPLPAGFLCVWFVGVEHERGVWQGSVNVGKYGQ